MAEGIERPGGEGNLRVELLTGNVKGKARQVLLDDVKAGKVWEIGTCTPSLRAPYDTMSGGSLYRSIHSQWMQRASLK